MPLDSDISNADSHLHVEFYMFDKAPYKDTPFVRIMVPGDKTNIIEQPAREHHKGRFIRQWLYFQSQNSDGQMIGTKLDQWNKEKPEDFNDYQMAELQILKFQTVEQIATATDAQIQRVGMGAAGLRDRARNYLTGKNKAESVAELTEAKSEIEKLKQQMAMLLDQKKVGRPRKEAEVNGDYNVGISHAGDE
tara:strand:+ start:2810 stop:3385 length:576 start_codon:yes stop_codon:yes gene_type:complete